MKEITFELTNYCPHHCQFCSSNVTDIYSNAIFLNPYQILEEIKHRLSINNIFAMNLTIHEEIRMILLYPEQKYVNNTIWFDRIHLSGGEPLSHPRFWEILCICKYFSKDVIVHTNALRHIAFNLHVLDNIYIESYQTISPDVDQIHILKRIEQGKELKRPEVHFSQNWMQNCSCHHDMVLPTGTIAQSPCKKEKIIRESLPNDKGIITDSEGEQYLITRYCPQCFSKKILLSHADKNRDFDKWTGKCVKSGCGYFAQITDFLTTLPSDIEYQQIKNKRKMELESEREELEDEINDINDKINKI